MTTVVAMTTTTTSSSNVVILAVIIVVVVVITQATWLSFIMFCRLDMHLVSEVAIASAVPGRITVFMFVTSAKFQGRRYAISVGLSVTLSPVCVHDTANVISRFH